MVASTAYGKFDTYEVDLLDLLNGLQIYGGS
jgi:hypothetical protein